MNKNQPAKNKPLPFLPAQETGWFIYIFELYCRWLFNRRFEKISIQCDYKPDNQQKTIYFLNHHSWWDGLIPFFLNQRFFHQRARGMMEDKQLHKYPFFRRLGVFSIDLSSPRSSMQSMRYAVQSMNRPGAALYIYPQGKIEPFKTENFKFKKGIGWLAKKVPVADLVPIGIHIHTMKSDKPILEILIGKPSVINHSDPTETISSTLENDLSSVLRSIHP